MKNTIACPGSVTGLFSSSSMCTTDSIRAAPQLDSYFGPSLFNIHFAAKENNSSLIRAAKPHASSSAEGSTMKPC
jgi:hypothetical protein